jgi:hypothetical protein
LAASIYAVAGECRAPPALSTNKYGNDYHTKSTSPVAQALADKEGQEKGLFFVISVIFVVKHRRFFLWKTIQQSRNIKKTG